jgi:hypothetical protein
VARHRWLARLPEEVRRAGAPTSQCCLFWTPSDADLAADGGGRSLWRRLRSSALGRSVRLALKVLHGLLGSLTSSSHREHLVCLHIIHITADDSELQNTEAFWHELS